MSLIIASPPLQTSLVTPPDNPRSPDAAYYIDPVWYRWLVESLVTRVQAGTTVVKTVTLTAQNASIATTSIPIGSVASGLYRLSWYTRVTTIGTVSSSLTVTFSWTESGIPLSSSGAAMTGNTTSTTQTGSILVRSDSAAALSYATTYASNGAGEMKYRIDLVAEFVS